MPAVHLRDGKPFQILINLKGCTDSNKADFAKLTVEPLVGSGLVIQGKPAFRLLRANGNTRHQQSSTLPPGKLPLQLKEGDVTKGLVFIDIVDAVPSSNPSRTCSTSGGPLEHVQRHVTEDTFGALWSPKYSVTYFSNSPRQSL